MTVAFRLILTALAIGSLLAQPNSSAPAQKETVVVTGTWEPIPLEEADRSIHAIDVKKLDLLSSTFFDLLQLDSSLDLRQRGPNGIQGDLSIRGASFGQTLILLDGLRLNDAQSGHHNLDLPVALDAIARVEILRGTGSTFYGSDATGGAVNFISQQPEASELRLRMAIGNFGQNQERGVLAWVGGPLAEQFTFSRDFSTGFQPDRDYRDLSLASVTHWTNRLGGTGLTLASSDRPFGGDQFYGNFPSWERTRGWFVGLHQNIGKKTEIAFAYRRHTDLFVLFRDHPEIFTNRHAVESYQAVVRRTEDLSRVVKLHYGVEGYHDAIVSNNLSNHQRARGSGYVSVDARAVRRFSVSAGVREEVYGGGQSQLSPSVSGGAWLGSKVKLRANVSRAFRLPSFTDLYYHDPANLGNPNLRPEKAWGSEAGLDWYPADNWIASATFFDRRERDGIDFVRNSPTDLWRATNFQRLRFTGVEASLKTTIARKHTVELQYTALHGAQDALAGAFSKYVFNYPLHSGIVQWQSSLPGDVVTRVRVGVVDRFARDAYGLLDLYAARGRGRIRPFVQITNATSTIYQEIQGVSMPKRGVLGGLEIKVF